MRLLRLALAALAGFVSACASTPPPPQEPARVLRAIAENQRGEQLDARGEYAAAAAHYRRALQAAEAIEDEDGIAANVVSLARVQHRAGDLAGATASLDRLLEERNLGFPARHVAEAAMRRALLALESADLALAERWVGHARNVCPEPCALRAKLVGVLAYLAIARGQPEEAELWATEAAALAKASAERDELANALRLLGAAALLRGEPARALVPLGEALAIDKQLALPRAIANDLVAMARAHAALGDLPQARAHYERAGAVAAADGNLPVQEQVRRALAALAPREPEK